MLCNKITTNSVNVKEHILIILRFHESGVRAWLSWVHCSGSRRDAIKLLARPWPRQGHEWEKIHFQAPSSCWQNPPLWSCRAEVHNFFVVVVGCLPEAALNS